MGYCDKQCNRLGLCYAQKYIDCGEDTWTVGVYADANIPGTCPTPEDCQS